MCVWWGLDNFGEVRDEGQGAGIALGFWLGHLLEISFSIREHRQSREMFDFAWLIIDIYLTGTGDYIL